MISNNDEKRHQRIMILQRDFRAQKVVTIASAVAKYGYTERTVRSWAKNGDVPLLETDGHTTVVPLTSQNIPPWLQ